ncbi:septum formation initiator family protein [Paeniglutamicibacter psychrophenolicus]|uniref:septum formation initiator family protein n=1 Tax=Paeniglutamicibacter psychrophenolicus TaxID=257454 RepID=UPI0027831160|nr:septum formation initiator family protein [Paeniglutamicibacter psychrophenolicus]MDQ0092580.1 cell division protein FtsB [Paeniglutamicibacter psychrophenolicus]
MATRRPPMPRSGTPAKGPARGADSDPRQAPGPEAAASEAPPKRPRPHREEPRQAQAAPGPAAAAPRPKVVPLGRVTAAGKPAPASPKPAAARPAASKAAPKPRTGPKSDSRPVAKPKAKTKASASQRRIEDRNLLSGAVRKDGQAAPPEPRKKPAGPKKPIPARSFSGRLLALSIALSVFAVLLVPSIGTYARQRDEIAALRTSIAAKQAEQEALKDQIARWDDPLYIKQQARDRINLVMPGERNYMVVGTRPEETAPGEPNQSPKEVRTDLPWVDALFDSAQRAATD